MSLHLTGDAAPLDHEADRVHEQVGVVDGHWDLAGAIHMHPRCYFHGLASCDVDRRPILRYLVSSSEYLEEGVWIPGPGDAFQPQLCYLPPFLTDIALHLPNALLQRHSSLDLQEAELRLQPGDACFCCGRIELARCHLNL
jgi:hypothetical protein